MLLVACRQLVAYLKDHGTEVADFTAGLKKPRVYRDEPKFYGLDELRRLIDAARGTRFELIVALGGLAGLRKGEIGRAEWGHVDFAEKVLLVKGKKTGSDRKVPLCPLLYSILLRHRQQSGPIVGGTGVRLNLYRDLRVVAKHAGVPYKALHSARHGFATELIARGADLAIVRDAGGWTNLSTVNRYVHTVPSRVRAAVDLLA